MVDAPVGTGIRSNSSRPSARSRFRWVGVWVGRGSGSAGRYRPVSGDGPASTPVPWSPPAGRSTLSGSIGGFSCSARSASPRFRRRVRLSRRSWWPLARFHGIRSPIEDGDWLCSAGSHRGSHSGSMGECVSVKSVPCVRQRTLPDAPALFLQAGGRGFESYRLHSEKRRRGKGLFDFGGLWITGS
jgi:hypothetical protein